MGPGRPRGGLGLAAGIALGTSYNVRLAEDRAAHVLEIRRGHQRVSEKNARELGPLVHEVIRRLNQLCRDHGDKRALVDEFFGLLKLLMRIRRVADHEGIIAGGVKPLAASRKPLALEQALHAARGDTTTPENVKVSIRIPEVRLRPVLVDDVISSLFELMENGLRYGGGNPVEVLSRPCTGGVLVIIEDAGEGMSEQQLDEYNEVLANPPGPEWHTQHETAQRGLFHVAHFTQQHGINVKLSEAALGGLRVVLRFTTEHFVPEDRATPGTPLPEPAATGPAIEAPAVQAPAGGGPARTHFAGHLPAASESTSPRARPATRPGPGTLPGLPKRTPRTNMNDELRKPAAPQPSEPVVPLSADEASNTTTAILRGAQQARANTSRSREN